MDPREFELFETEMNNLFNDLDGMIDDNDAESKNHIEDLRIRLEHLSGSEIDWTEENVSNLWNQIDNFVDFLSQEHTRVANYLRRISFGPKYWLWAGEVPLDFGYSNKHDKLWQSNQNPSGRHTYIAQPPSIKWKLTKIQQEGGRIFYTTVVEINKLDAVTKVPSIRPNLSTSKASLRIIKKTNGKQQWQRSLEPRRLLNISKFLDDPSNGFANAPMIFAPEHEAVTFAYDRKGHAKSITIDFSFLIPHEEEGTNLLTDHKSLTDLRPLQIIDGQHRVRGAMRSERGHELNIPIIIFPPDLTENGAAKYFSEINTLSEPLNVLHEMFMRHRFALSSTKPSKNFEYYDGTRETYRARANRLAYESAAYCNLNSEALEKLIKILVENPENNHIASIDMWVKHAHYWFGTNGPYGPEKIDDDSEVWRDEIANYFDAFMEICNTDWDDEKPRWRTFDQLAANDRGGNRPYIQYKTTFRALMHQLPTIVGHIRRSGFDGPTITIKRFKQYLKVLGNIDWLDPGIKSHFLPSSGGERAWKCLMQWFDDAVSRGEEDAYDVEEVMSDDIPSIRGKGILSGPDKGDVWFEDEDHKWPTEDRPTVTIYSRRPYNAYYICESILMDDDGNRLNEGASLRKTVAADIDYRMCKFVIKAGSWSTDIDKAKLTIVWGNAVKKEVSTTITLSRD